MKQSITYECEGCGARSHDRDAIERCEALPMRPTDIKPGDIVIIGQIGGSGYGWWHGGEEWFLRDDASKDDPPSDNHHRRHTIGHPKYAVLDVVPYRDVTRMPGAYGHRYAAILFSPDHANRVDDRVAYFWHGCEGLTKVDELSPAKLNEFRGRAAKFASPEYATY
jgi:hypothetical protein